MNIFLHKIKKGKLSTWVSWCREIDTTLKSKALKIIKEENLSYEAFGIFSVHGDFYTLGITVGKYLLSKKTHNISIKHLLKIEECLEKIGPLELLYELDF